MEMVRLGEVDKMINDKKICFIGAGSMAEAMISGISAKNLIPVENITVINKSNKERINKLVDKYGVKYTFNKESSIREADIIILAVKPKDVFEAINQIRPYTNKNQLIISVIAGVSTSLITELLQHEGAVIRTMPNTSAMIGFSATAMATGEYATNEDLLIAKILLEAVGIVSIVNEDSLDAVTGLSGSGPAYIYYLVEVMEESAVQLGLKHQTARELIIQTLIGAGHMLQQTELEPSILREKVTSPGGTTMAGLEALREFQFQETIFQAIKNATERSKELGKIISKAE